MKSKSIKISFDKSSISELNNDSLEEVKGGTFFTRSIQIPTINFSTNTLCTSDAK